MDEDEDDLFTHYIQAATGYAETWMGRYLMPATLEAIFNSYCTCGCCNSFRLTGRLFNFITKIEVWNGTAYIELTTAQYTITKSTWEANVCISNEVVIDYTFDNGCQVQPETVKITYTVGDYRTVDIATITFEEDVGTTTTTTPHDLKNGDQVIQSETGEDVFNGTFGIIVLGPSSYAFEFVGTPAGNVSEGLATIPEIPPNIELGVMQMGAAMIANKGDCSDKCGAVPCTAQKLLKQYRRYVVRSPNNDCCCR